MIQHALQIALAGVAAVAVLALSRKLDRSTLVAVAVGTILAVAIVVERASLSTLELLGLAVDTILAEVRFLANITRRVASSAERLDIFADSILARQSASAISIVSAAGFIALSAVRVVWPFGGQMRIEDIIQSGGDRDIRGGHEGQGEKKDSRLSHLVWEELVSLNPASKKSGLQ